MKKFTFGCLALITILFSCNNDKKPGTVIVSEDGKEKVTIDANSLSKGSDAFTRRSEELGKLTPYTPDQIKALFPETLNGIPRSGYTSNSAMGAMVATGEYKINDSASYELTLLDCAGEAGAGLYAIQYLALMNAESETEDEYMKRVDFNGIQAAETLNKTSQEATLSYLAGDRVLVTLKGDHVGLDAVKKAAGSLKVK